MVQALFVSPLEKADREHIIYPYMNQINVPDFKSSATLVEFEGRIIKELSGELGLLEMD